MWLALDPASSGCADLPPLQERQVGRVAPARSVIVMDWLGARPIVVIIGSIVLAWGVLVGLLVCFLRGATTNDDET